MAQFGIAFPFKETNEGGIIAGNTDSKKNIESNLLAFITTRRRARVMRSKFYSPIFDYLMEILDDVTINEMNEDLKNAISKWFPEIAVTNINSSTVNDQNIENLLTVIIQYNIPNLGVYNSSLEVGFLTNI